MNGWLYAVLSVVLLVVSLATILIASVVIAWWLARLAKAAPVAKPPRADGPTRRSLLADDTPRRRSQRLRRAHIILPPVALNMPTQPSDYADYPAQGEQIPPWEAPDEPPDLWQAYLETLRDRWEASTIDML
jgi:hypothetical protein